MRTKIVALVLALTVVLPAPLAGADPVGLPKVPRCAQALAKATHDHDHASARHPKAICKMHALAELEVSKDAGLGQVEIHGTIAAVLQRDEGIVSLIDVKDPRKPKVVGRYDDDIADSFDGDLAFSRDGDWLFYARQTHQFSKDGIHVLDISNPKEPRLAFYQPQGGSFRIGYLRHGGEEYIATMDAITGLVINRFEPTSGALIPIFADALPALKVGGPASAGIFIDPKDPQIGVPVLYATNGQTGLDVYDLSDPMSPIKLGSWSEAGLADVEVKATKKGRVVYAASEYWFTETTPASVYMLNASRFNRMSQKARFTADLEASDTWRVNGLELVGNRLQVALSHIGLASFTLDGRPKALYQQPRAVNKSSTLRATPYAMDVDSSGGLLYLTDASTGMLTILKAR